MAQKTIAITITDYATSLKTAFTGTEFVLEDKTVGGTAPFLLDINGKQFTIDTQENLNAVMARVTENIKIIGSEPTLEYYHIKFIYDTDDTTWKVEIE